MDMTEKMAADIAVKLNGGEWSDGKWYSEGHRKAWIDAVKPYADEIERLREALQKIVKEAEISIDEEHAFNGLLAAEYIARSALQQKETE